MQHASGHRSPQQMLEAQLPCATQGRAPLTQHAAYHAMWPAEQRQEHPCCSVGPAVSAGWPRACCHRRVDPADGQVASVCGCAGMQQNVYWLCCCCDAMHAAFACELSPPGSTVCIATSALSYRVPVPADATAEKNTRAAFKAEVDRRLSRKTLVILDTLNNIKGFRWVHCHTPVEEKHADSVLWHLCTLTAVTEPVCARHPGMRSGALRGHLAPAHACSTATRTWSSAESGMQHESMATQQRCLTTWQDDSSDQTAPVDGTLRYMSAHRPSSVLLLVRHGYHCALCDTSALCTGMSRSAST